MLFYEKFSHYGWIAGAGKSTIRKQQYSKLYCVDCDQIKERILGYDLQNPSEVHSLSKVMEKEEIYKCLSRGISFVYDTTASNQERIEKMIKEAKDLGYFVTICYVKVSLDTAIKRNRNRKRVVPENIIIEKSSILDNSIESFSKIADNLNIICNEKEDQFK